ncbi:ribosomal RNA small subunit methyltransferase A, partial [Candidatus Uhrbacteria bacterium]|nr:ribosomal RNA small subunit methyltransferase A [Candidatus Uhrbacteria bacterium]
MTPAEIKEALKGLGIRATRVRGQHFLVDRGALKKIVDAAELANDDAVLEIGPGLGVLTRELVRHAGCVCAVELDQALATRLDSLGLPKDRLTVRRGDVRAIPNAALVGPCTKKRYKLVANIPYNITSDVLEKFLLEEPSPVCMVLLVQREIAERIVASAGRMSRLGVLVQYFGKPDIVSRVDRHAFWPAPRVESAIVRVRRYPEEVLGRREMIVSRDEFFRVVRSGFAAPRKKLLGNLRGGLGRARSEVARCLLDTKIS